MVKAESIHDIIRLTNQLSEKEVKQIIAMLQDRMQHCSEDPNDVDCRLYRWLQQELKAQLKMNTLPYKKNPNRKNFKAAVQHVEEHLHGWLGPLTQVQKESLYGLLARLVVRAARGASNSNIPIWHLITAQVGNLPKLLEDAFPGYLGSGLLPIMLSRREAGDGRLVDARHQPNTQAAPKRRRLPTGTRSLQHHSR
jgi:hypothetical protein